MAHAKAKDTANLCARHKPWPTKTSSENFLVSAVLMLARAELGKHRWQASLGQLESSMSRENCLPTLRSAPARAYLVRHIACILHMKCTRIWPE
jgi:hypothetical protein